MTSSQRQLEALSSDAFLNRFAQIGTVEGIYAAMQRSREVRSLHAAMREEVVNETGMDAYVRALLRSFVHGQQFSHQLSIAAIAVACVGINRTFARGFIAYLASMRSLEMHLASQVAAQALQSIPITIRETIGEGTPDNDVRYLKTVPRSDAGQTTFVIEEELVDA
jgi:hypothetical protein